MTAAEVSTAIESARLVAIVRTAGADAYRTAEVLVEAGVEVLEISLTVPKALDVVERLRATVGDRALIGAGTVLDKEDAQWARDAGAQFLVSPNLDVEVVRWARDCDLLHLPGVFTPTETATALGAGATLLKLFPAATLGPGFVRELLAPFPTARFVPTGGIDEESAPAYFAAGAVAVGVAGALTSGDRALLPDRVHRLLAVTRPLERQENT